MSNRQGHVFAVFWGNFSYGQALCPFVLLFAALLLVSPLAASQSTQLDTYFDMSLEELMSVSIVSGRLESSLASPGIVSSYDARQLRALGLHSLKDFLHFVPGLELSESFAGKALLQVRGMPASSNQKMLFMLNGVPYWMPENGDIPLNGVPFSAIEKIEIIRGPGSVLYGTNASAGVVNVITREEAGFLTDVKINSDDLYNASLYGGKKFDNGAWWNIAYEGQKDNGYLYEVEQAFAIDPCFCFPETANGEQLRQEQYQSLLSRFGWQSLQGSMHHYQSENAGDANGSIFSSTLYTERGTQFALSYAVKQERSDWEVYSDWNRYHREANVEDLLTFFYLPGDGSIDFDTNGHNNTRWRSGIKWNLQMHEQLAWQNGLEYEERRTENQKFRDADNGNTLFLITQPPYNLPFQLQNDGSILLIEEATTYEHAAYSQLDYQHGQWRTVLGLRYVDNSVAGQDISPRGSVVYHWSEQQSIKLLYAEGFNSPTFSQSAATDVLGMPQNIEIKAETIKTWDLAYSYIDGGFSHVASLFYTEADDLIDNIQNRDAVLRRSGLEYDVRFKYEGWNLLAGLSLIAEGNGHGSDSEAAFASRWLTKLGAGYHFHQHGFGASLRSAGSRAGVDAYHLLNLNYRYTAMPGWQWYVTLDNVLNDKVWQPDVRNYASVQMQGHRERSLFLGFQYEFSSP